MGKTDNETRHNIERLVVKHGEQHRRLIEDAYHFFIKRYPVWGVSKPYDLKINSDIKSLIEKAEKN